MHVNNDLLYLGMLSYRGPQLGLICRHLPLSHMHTILPVMLLSRFHSSVASPLFCIITASSWHLHWTATYLLLYSLTEVTCYSTQHLRPILPVPLTCNHLLPSTWYSTCAPYIHSSTHDNISVISTALTNCRTIYHISIISETDGPAPEVTPRPMVGIVWHESI